MVRVCWAAELDKELNAILEAHSTVFQEGLEKVEGVKAKIYIDSSEMPRFFKARPVAYALRENRIGSTCQRGNYRTS